MDAIASESPHSLTIDDIREKIDKIRDVVLIRRDDGIFVSSHVEGENDLIARYDVGHNHHDDDIPKIYITGYIYAGASGRPYFLTTASIIKNRIHQENIYVSCQLLFDYMNAIVNGSALEPQDELCITLSALILENLNNGNYNDKVLKYYLAP